MMETVEVLRYTPTTLYLLLSFIDRIGPNQNKHTSSSTVAGPLERSLRVPLPVPILLSLPGLAPFDLGSSISVNDITETESVFVVVPKLTNTC